MLWSRGKLRRMTVAGALLICAVALFGCGNGVSIRDFWGEDLPNVCCEPARRSTHEPPAGALSSVDRVVPVEAPRPKRVQARPLAAADSLAQPPQPAASPASNSQASATADTTAMPVTPGAGGIRLLVPEQTFRLEGRPRALRVSYDDLDLLRVLNMDPVPADAVSHFPAWLRDLDGKTVRLRGFMYPSYEEPLTAFVLARDNQICCFGRDPKPYDLVTVKLRDGVTTPYIQNRPFDVVGTFSIAPYYDDGVWFQLYRITDAVIVE